MRLRIVVNLPAEIARVPRPRITTLALLVFSLLSITEAVRQHLESRKLHALAEHIVADAHATDRRSQVIALRDYIRAHVTSRGAPAGDAERPFLRATALETLESGLGFCGEDSRAFLVLADAVGIPAARINLYGPAHVVVLTDLDDGGPVIVDAMNPPVVEELEPLDKAIVRHGFLDYSTLNVRRLHIGWLFSRIKLTIGPLTFWGENPHAMKALFWGAIAAMILALRGARRLLRYLLLRRGWVHRTSLTATAAPTLATPLREDEAPQVARTTPDT